MKTLDKSNIFCIFTSSNKYNDVSHEFNQRESGVRKQKCPCGCTWPDSSSFPVLFCIVSKKYDSRATGLNVELSTIMRTAWAVRKSENISMSCALKLAWKSFKLKLRMKTEVVKFAFKKIDGTVREAVGTLVSSMLPQRGDNQPAKERAKNYGVQVYYDLDRDCFRSFKVSSLLLN